MTMQDYKVIDMPSLLARSVLVQDCQDSTRWVRDESWYSDVKAINSNLYEFLISNKIIDEPGVNDIDELVVMYSQLSDAGKILFTSGRVDKWKESFDRGSSKKIFSDVQYLEKSLYRILTVGLEADNI